MGLPDLMIDHVGCGLVTTLDTARQMSLMIDRVAWTHGCSCRAWPGDYFGHGPIDDIYGAKGNWDFRISDLAKNPDETDI